MGKLHLGTGFNLPAEAANDVIAIVGRRGRGKTTTAVVLVEELHAAGERFCIADPVGVWWGLKSSRDGKGPGIPVVVMGGDRGDVPLEDTAGKVIGDFVADPSSPSVVLDFRAFRKGQITRFMTDFMEQLYHRNRAPLHIVLDEGDQFAPQRVTGDVARLVGAAEDLCKMGRARGLHPIVITQRPAALNKNVLTQAGILIAHGLTGPQDIKAVEAWIHERADESHRAEVLKSLPGLHRGQAWVWAPELEILRQVQIRDRTTYDSSATPKGDAPKGPRVQAEVDLDALKTRIASTIEKAKESDPRELRKQLVEAKARIATLQKALEEKAGELERRVARLDELAKKPLPKIPAFKDSQVKRLETVATRMVAEAERHGKAMADFWKNQDEVNGALLSALRSVAEGQAVPRAHVAAPAPMRRGPVSVTRIAPPPPRPRPAGQGDGSATIGGGERKVLTAIAQHSAGVTREQLTVLTGYKRSSRDTYLQRLRQAGLVVEEGETILATIVGANSLGPDFEPLPTGAHLREHWRGRLPAGELRLYEVLVDAYPKAVDRDALSEATDYKRSSRDTYLQRLSARRLIELVGRGAVRASSQLFEEA